MLNVLGQINIQYNTIQSFLFQFWEFLAKVKFSVSVEVATKLIPVLFVWYETLT
jgi:hypothetical protein